MSPEKDLRGESCDSSREVNPFSTRFVRPGAIAYQFPDSLTAEKFIGRLAVAHWRGQIVGPHGSGKSTLLASILPALEATGLDIRSIALHDGQRTLPVEFLQQPPKLESELAVAIEPTVVESGSPDTKPRGLLIIDGYEQLSRWTCFKLRRFCRQGSFGLLVTTHRSVGLPTVFETNSDPTLIARLAAELQQSLTPDRQIVTGDDVTEALNSCGGNARESFFALYDLYEQRRKG